jgi:hypothetical protein
LNEGPIAYATGPFFFGAPKAGTIFSGGSLPALWSHQARVNLITQGRLDALVLKKCTQLKAANDFW